MVFLLWILPWMFMNLEGIVRNWVLVESFLHYLVGKPAYF